MLIGDYGNVKSTQIQFYVLIVGFALQNGQRVEYFWLKGLDNLVKFIYVNFSEHFGSLSLYLLIISTEHSN